jgi:holo-[acyl-carrier protein] synthase
MILGTGVDIVEVSRIRRARERRGERFLSRVFTERESAFCMSGPGCDLRLAARFAAKEACLKALRTGLTGGITWSDIEVTGDDAGAPSLLLHGRAARVAGEMGARRLHLSLSHTARYAVALVVIEG